MTKLIEFRNEFTSDLDSHLKSPCNRMRKYTVGSYLYIDMPTQEDFECVNYPAAFVVAFRYPGATRGHVLIDRYDGKVLDVVFYDTACVEPGKLSTSVECYKPSVVTVGEKWHNKPMLDLLEVLHQLPEYKDVNPVS